MKNFLGNRSQVFSIFFLMLFLCFLPCQLLAAVTIDSRTDDVKEVLKFENPGKSPLLKGFKGFSIEKVREAYQESRPRTQAWLKEENVSYSSFVEFLLRVVMLFKMTADSPEKAMAILLPIFAVFFIISVIPFTYTALFVPPDMENPQKPENDTINRLWFGRGKKSPKKEGNQVREEDLPDSEEDVEEEDEENSEDEMEEEEAGEDEP
ncbi:TPA: hypothetical protein DCG86_09445 [Candidatus Marinimicrobia bacterium]|nr:MAG: hypothetical protein XD77_0575 [Marinimicrobia bacterium 46_47]KUK90334.1 MAG: hypothetical protein XE04_1507 [Marinimicrobia bacterium 46_43]HAE88228.1 hypothetical protein [Candidatus Neomarinimicrobiota bacterium]HBY19083.1 hypothetical protein [Candidatus Neomarinimicrobiota bacterium]